MIITNIINKIKMINLLKIFIILIFTSSILGCTNNQIEKNVFSPDKINLKVLNSDKKSLKEYEFYIINFIEFLIFLRCFKRKFRHFGSKYIFEFF